MKNLKFTSSLSNLKKLFEILSVGRITSPPHCVFYTVPGHIPMMKDAIDIKAAKRKVLSNLRLLNSRLQGLCRSSASFDALYTFYSQKVDEQLNILEWSEKFYRNTISADPMVRSSVGRSKGCEAKTSGNFSIQL